MDQVSRDAAPWTARSGLIGGGITPLLKGTVRETLASYGSVPESGPPFPLTNGSSNQLVLPFYFSKGLFSLSIALAEPYLAGAEATATQRKNELRNKTLALERVQRHSGPTTIQVMSDSEAKLDRLFYVESPKN
ncbi:hypothetical protein LXL04_039976 [Taraxacum kok-saghyz]